MATLMLSSHSAANASTHAETTFRFLLPALDVRQTHLAAFGPEGAAPCFDDLNVTSNSACQYALDLLLQRQSDGNDFYCSFQCRCLVSLKDPLGLSKRC